MDIFYLGTHQVDHLERAGVPLFVSHRRLAGRKTLPRAIAVRRRLGRIPGCCSTGSGP